MSQQDGQSIQSLGGQSDSLDGIHLRSDTGQSDLVSERLKEELEQDDHATEGDDEDSLEMEEKENQPPILKKKPFIEEALTTSQAVRHLILIGTARQVYFQFSHHISAENMAKQTNYFLLAGAAVVGLAAVYLKTTK